MSRIFGRILIAFGVIVVLLVIIGLIAALRTPKYSPAPMPNPNGYDDLVKANARVTIPSRLATNKPSRSELIEAVATNVEALQLARVGIARECCVPTRDNLTNAAARAFSVNGFSTLAQAFRLEGRLAELEQRPADAAQSYLAITRLGQEAVRGGVVIDAMQGSAVEARGLAPLELLSTRLNAEQCKQLITALDSADARRETVDTVVQQEKIWARRAFGWQYYLHPMVIAQTRHRAAAINVPSARTRRLIITLAARAFELEHNAKPGSIDDLVPAYLKTIPKDPFTGKEMAYSP